MMDLIGMNIIWFYIYNKWEFNSIIFGRDRTQMTTIYFVRHAHSIYTPNELERPLSERGLCDVDRLNKIFTKKPIDLVLASPYKRAIQTVEGIAKANGKEVITNPAFRERLLSSEPVGDFHQAISKVWTHPSFAWTGGESNIDAQTRGVQATLGVLEQYEGKRIAIGTHGNLMVLIMQYFDQRFDFSFWQQLAMPDVYQLEFIGRELKSVKRIWKEN